MKTPHYYNIAASSLEHWLGSLEACVMGVLWASPSPLTLQQVYADGRRRIGWRAKTTVQTTLKRLERKGVIAGGRNGRYKWAAMMTREMWIQERVSAVLDSLVAEYDGEVRAWLREWEK
jgi:predicted transcriptional regulator